ncbi:MAG: hypothetical protein B0W54_16515 [Cellvibrio sp. 79]|nr:MAG: hypothetical protein B0W54_16515 [Cellvibrio sp. 79]
MRKLTSFLIASVLIVFSVNSMAIPVRHHFAGEVENSSFGYEGKSITGWYEYDFDDYDPNEPNLYNFFNYYLQVGDLAITEGQVNEIYGGISYFNGSAHGFSLSAETPYDVNGSNYALDVFTLGFSDGQSGTPENYIPTPSTLDLSGLLTGSFEIYGHSSVILPDQSEGVFWLTGSLQQVDAAQVPEPSLALMFALGLAFLVGLRRKLR